MVAEMLEIGNVMFFDFALDGECFEKLFLVGEEALVLLTHHLEDLLC